MWIQGWGELPGRLIVLSGPSGSGKSTLLRLVLGRAGVEAELSVSATSRAPRPGERDGIDYHFWTPDQFREGVERGAFLEWAEYNGNFYGTPCGPVFEALRAGRRVVLEIETQGAMKVREVAPTAHFVFVDAPDFATLAARLRGRATEPDEQIHRRLVIARQERDQSHRYDIRIINDDLERAATELAALLGGPAEE